MFLKHFHCSKLVQTRTLALSSKSVPRQQEITLFFESNEKLKNLKQYIPRKYFQTFMKHHATTESLYLTCPDAAKKIASYMLPVIRQNENQIVCETSPGLGLITSELLDNGIKFVRMYELCPEFRHTLKDFGQFYPGQVELFTKNIFDLNRYDYLDKQDQTNRVELLLKNVPKKSWMDDPVMTIVGAMSSMNFIKCLVKMLTLQTGIVTYGRVELFAIIRPRDYAVLTSKPPANLVAYQKLSVMFDLFFDCEFLEKFDRRLFLPWQAPFKHSMAHRYPQNLEPDMLYLVRINFKKEFPLSMEHMLAFWYFVLNLFRRGNNRVIPTIEKWIPNCGVNLLVPKLDHGGNYYKSMDIFTTFGEMNPKEILAVFKEMINSPSYETSSFKSLIETQLLRSETVESGLYETANRHLEKHITEEIEVKL